MDELPIPMPLDSLNSHLDAARGEGLNPPVLWVEGADVQRLSVDDARERLSRSTATPEELLLRSLDAKVKTHDLAFVLIQSLPDRLCAWMPAEGDFIFQPSLSINRHESCPFAFQNN